MKKTERHERKSIKRNVSEKSCKNNPEPVPFEIIGFRGLKCNVCMEVLEYESDGTNLNED